MTRLDAPSNGTVRCLRRSQAWLFGLIVWSASHATSAQQARRRRLQEALLGASVATAVRWRTDDPDLVRRGLHPSAAAALAEGAQVVRSADADLDGDGVDETIVEVAPRVDPAPFNTATGLVVMHRRPGGWEPQVVARPTADAYRREPAFHLAAIGWRLFVEGRRQTLVLAYDLMTLVETGEHGHTDRHETILARVRFGSEGLEEDGVCMSATVSDIADEPWHASGEFCHRVRPGREQIVQGEVRPRRECEEVPTGEDWVYLWRTRELPQPAWCRAYLRQRQHDFRQNDPPLEYGP